MVPMDIFGAGAAGLGARLGWRHRLSVLAAAGSSFLLNLNTQIAYKVRYKCASVGHLLLSPGHPPPPPSSPWLPHTHESSFDNASQVPATPRKRPVFQSACQLSTSAVEPARSASAPPLRCRAPHVLPCFHGRGHFFQRRNRSQLGGRVQASR